MARKRDPGRTGRAYFIVAYSNPCTAGSQMRIPESSTNLQAGMNAKVTSMCGYARMTARITVHQQCHPQDPHVWVCQKMCGKTNCHRVKMPECLQAQKNTADLCKDTRYRQIENRQEKIQNRRKTIFCKRRNETTQTGRAYERIAGQKKPYSKSHAQNKSPQTAAKIGKFHLKQTINHEKYPSASKLPFTLLSLCKMRGP